MEALTVVIEVIGGLCHVVEKPKGVRVIVKDFDCEDAHRGRKSGRHSHDYTESSKVELVRGISQ